MKPKIMAAAAILLLFSSAAYAFHPRPRHRARIVSGPELGWFACGHRHESAWVERQYCPECSPPVVYFEYEWRSDGYGRPDWRCGWDHRRPDWYWRPRGGWRGPGWVPERDYRPGHRDRRHG